MSWNLVGRRAHPRLLPDAGGTRPRRSISTPEHRSPSRTSSPGSRPARRTRSSSTHSRSRGRRPSSAVRWPPRATASAGSPVITTEQPLERLGGGVDRLRRIRQTHAGGTAASRSAARSPPRRTTRAPSRRSPVRSRAPRRSRPRSPPRARRSSRTRRASTWATCAADVADVQAHQEPPDGPVLRRLDLIEQVGDRLVLEAGELRSASRHRGRRCRRGLRSARVSSRRITVM